MDSEEATKTICSTKFMQTIPGGFREKVSDVLLEISKLRRVPLGETWIQEGDKADARGFILLKGSVSIRKGGEQAHSEEAPELLGEIMQFNPAHSRTATVVATDECVVMRFDWDDLWAKLGEKLTEDEVSKVKTAVESFAWEHFTR